MAALSRETQENARNSQSQNTFVPGKTEEYITQVSEEIEGRVTKKLFQELSKTESRFLAALSKLDEFPLNPQVRSFSGTIPGTSRNSDLENPEPTGDRSQNGPYPEVELSTRRTSNSADSDEEETSQTVTGFQEDIPHCSLGISSGKEKKARSTNQPQFRSENTPATIETNQILWAFY